MLPAIAMLSAGVRMTRALLYRKEHGPMSELLIEGLHADMQPKAREHRKRANAMGIDIVFTSGYRTPAEQMVAFSKGRALDASGLWHVVDPRKVVTNALPAQAPHCRRGAYDIAPIVNEHVAWDRLDLFAELGRIGKELDLVWGGDWQKLKDMPHFELVYWRSLPVPT
jgi:peptidoglycan L-alanyl-D-glutamate endopeptidase CwlK